MCVVRSLAVLLCVAACCACSRAAPDATGEPPAEQPAPAPVQAPSAPSEEELAALRGAVESHPDDPEAHRHYARALKSAHRRDEAVLHFERAVQLAPRDARCLLDLALTYAALSRLDEAEAIYKHLEQAPQLRPLAWHNEANVALRRGELDRAIELYHKAIEAKPDYMLAYYHLGLALEQAERFRDAYDAFAKAVEFEPTGDPEAITGHLDALYHMGKLDLMMGATVRAAELLAALLEADPDHPNAHYQYGRALLLLGRQAEAQREFDQHMRLQAEKPPTAPMGAGE